MTRIASLTPRAAASLIAMGAMASQTHAAEYSRTMTIQRVAGVSGVRPAYPGSENVFRIYSTVVQSWGSSSCRADAADLSMDDWHIYPIVMRAWKENLQVTVVVESSMRIDTTDTVCKIVAVNVV